MAESLHEMAKRWVKHNKGSATTNSLYELIARSEIADYEIETLRAWAAANPVKSYKDDFFEKFPNAPRANSGRPLVCTSTIYGLKPCPGSGDCHKCWDAPLGTWDSTAPVLDERTPPDNGDVACQSCKYMRLVEYNQPCARCEHNSGKEHNYIAASATEMERRRKG